MQLVRCLGLLLVSQGLTQATEDRSKPRFAKQPEIYLRSELGEANYTYPLLWRRALFKCVSQSLNREDFGLVYLLKVKQVIVPGD